MFTFIGYAMFKLAYSAPIAFHRQRGATMIEYALIVALISIVAVVVLGTMGDSINSLFTSANTELSGATPE